MRCLPTVGKRSGGGFFHNLLQHPAGGVDMLLLKRRMNKEHQGGFAEFSGCLLYTSDAADE